VNTLQSRCSNIPRSEYLDTLLAYLDNSAALTVFAQAPIQHQIDLAFQHIKRILRHRPPATPPQDSHSELQPRAASAQATPTLQHYPDTGRPPTRLGKAPRKPLAQASPAASQYPLHSAQNYRQRSGPGLFYQLAGSQPHGRHVSADFVTSRYMQCICLRSVSILNPVESGQ